ncbi:hypothetical protein [Spelaeicoccus albus]|uniref:Putative membrane protein YedE/YeeE n=1 Tax=Spelaeicoccus albus TaxID=1280376 RepID=A0A7Z0AA86_9MICO|nr:hypothetical protein [Spelaeicoccus albus]NYI67274.1 putative membrane protein YedE/YeeE [Spelaeicoccus albus]
MLISGLIVGAILGFAVRSVAIDSSTIYGALGVSPWIVVGVLVIGVGLGGGALMGIGASLAGGCTVGNGLAAKLTITPHRNRPVAPGDPASVPAPRTAAHR